MFQLLSHTEEIYILGRDLFKTQIHKAKSQGKTQIASLCLDLKHCDALRLVQDFSSTSIPFLYHHKLDSTHLFAGQLLKHLSSGKAPRFEEAQAFFHPLKELYTSQNASYPLHLACAFNFSETGEEPCLECFVPKWHFFNILNHNYLSLYYLISPETSIESCEADLCQDLAFLQNPAKAQPSPSPSLTLIKSSLSHYKDTVSKALEFLKNSHHKKVTLAAYSDYHIQGSIDLLSLFHQLKLDEPHSTLFCFSLNKHQSFFGASPESLVCIKDQSIFVDALAGSSLRINNTAEATEEKEQLLQDPKILEEHRYVVDAILDALSALGLEPTCPAKPAVKTLKHLYHLFTPIEASTNSTHSVFDLIGALHPTPALGTYPKSKDYTCIQELEGFDRKLYGGGLGWINSQADAHITVNIRCAQLNNSCLRFFAGCGLTQASIPEVELEELQTKLKTLLKHFKHIADKQEDPCVMHSNTGLQK
jgi:menaquinone-specific isochorismate synthase